LTDRDAWTWDEVPVLGYGWVTVDPTPVRTTADVAPPPEQVTASPTTVAQAGYGPADGGAAHAIAKPVNVKLARPLKCELAVGYWAPACPQPWSSPCWPVGWACPPCAGACGAGPGNQTGDPVLMTAARGWS